MVLGLSTLIYRKFFRVGLIACGYDKGKTQLYQSSKIPKKRYVCRKLIGENKVSFIHFHRNASVYRTMSVIF